jgi:cation:H+ antiporter
VPSIWIAALWGVAAASAIYVASVYFVNGIDWLAARLHLGETATGAILAALGTALPETAITLMAVVAGKRTADLGVGTAMGGPLALSTIGYGVLALALLSHGQPLELDSPTRGRLTRHQVWFLVIAVFGLGLGLISSPLKVWGGALLIVSYGVYVWLSLRSDASDIPAKFDVKLKLTWRDHPPSILIACVQIALALSVTLVASRVFVHQLERAGHMIGLRPQLLALLLSPIATESPEIFNVILWAKRGRSSLALSNISGAMVLQATLPAALGLIYTPWRLDPVLAVGGLITLMAVGAAMILLSLRTGSRRILALLPIPYLVYFAFLLAR